MKITRAISIRQPFAELILQGKKKFENRTIRTNIRERVYIYASLKPKTEPGLWKKAGKKPGSLPMGFIVGSVEIVGCLRRGRKRYAYKLKGPKRVRKLRPKNQPSPVFWRPVF